MDYHTDAADTIDVNDEKKNAGLFFLTMMRFTQGAQMCTFNSKTINLTVSVIRHEDKLIQSVRIIIRSISLHSCTFFFFFTIIITFNRKKINKFPQKITIEEKYTLFIYIHM